MRNALGLMLASVMTAVAITAVWFWTSSPRADAAPPQTIAARKITLALAFAASFSAVSSTASFAFSSEAQQQCTGDAFRLCSSEIPNIPKITACMMKHRADLSVGCRGVMDRELASQKSGKLAAQ